MANDYDKERCQRFVKEITQTFAESGFETSPLTFDFFQEMTNIDDAKSYVIGVLIGMLKYYKEELEITRESMEK